MQAPYHTQDGKPPFIMHVPVISTSHITESDGLRLGLCKREVFASEPGGDGSWQMVEFEGLMPGDRSTVVGDDFSDDFRPEHYSPEFREVLAHFARLGYNYVRFDADGDLIVGLPAFDW